MAHHFPLVILSLAMYYSYFLQTGSFLAAESASYQIRLLPVSDSLRCAGMPDGDYELGGQPITMKNGKATLTGTDTLAGSSIHLMEGLRRAVRFGVPLEAAVTAATLAPARAIGAADTIGSLEPGKAADFVLLDHDLHVKSVYIDGSLLV